jgi:epoxyqueuosine reductase
MTERAPAPGDDGVVLTRCFEARAREEGFDAVGIARAERLERDALRLSDWLARGRQAGMAWMARFADRRGDPRRLLPGCESVIVVATSYWPGEEAAERPPGLARVARSAQGRDYHR